MFCCWFTRKDGDRKRVPKVSDTVQERVLRAVRTVPLELGEKLTGMLTRRLLLSNTVLKKKVKSLLFCGCNSLLRNGKFPLLVVNLVVFVLLTFTGLRGTKRYTDAAKYMYSTRSLCNWLV